MTTELTTVLDRLNKASVEKHYDAYADVAWDAPEMAVDPADPRWELTGVDPLTDTEWYRSRPPAVRAEIGLYRIAAAMRLGWEFENVLQRGLLEYAFWLPNGAPEFRYLHHEIVEESHHTMMFQEFVNRSGLDVPGIPLFEKLTSRLVVRSARRFPSLFFMFVLGGEDPVDHLQRLRLAERGGHPLVERIMRIHVAEEARHLSFARQYLADRVPRLGRVRRTVLTVVAPIELGIMARMFVLPPKGLLRRYGVPRPVVRAAARSPHGRAVLRDCLGKTRRMCRELGLVPRWAVPLWRVMGIWDPA